MSNSQRKGKQAEREFAKLVNDVLECNAKRTPQSGGMSFKGDLIDININSIAHTIHWEVKRQESLNVWKAYNQALVDSRGTNKIPTVNHRKNNTIWLTTLDSRDFLNILKELEGLRNDIKNRTNP